MLRFATARLITNKFDNKNGFKLIRISAREREREKKKRYYKQVTINQSEKFNIIKSSFVKVIKFGLNYMTLSGVEVLLN